MKVIIISDVVLSEHRYKHPMIVVKAVLCALLTMPENICEVAPQASFLLPQKVRKVTAVKALKSGVRSQARSVFFRLSAPLLPPPSQLDGEGSVQHTEGNTKSSKNRKKAKLNRDSFRTVPTVTASVWFSISCVLVSR